MLQTVALASLIDDARVVIYDCNMFIIEAHCVPLAANPSEALFGRSGNNYCKGELNTVDLFIKIGCFIKKEKYSFSKLVGTRRSTVLILPFVDSVPSLESLDMGPA